MSGRYGRPSAQTAELVRQMLAEMAGRLEANRPDELLTATGRLAMMQATTMDPTMASALRQQVPVIVEPVTRRDFAARLREIAGAS